MIAAQQNADPAERLSAPRFRPRPADDAARELLARAIDLGQLELVSSEGSSAFPDVVVWPHRVREPNIVHAGQAAVARALRRGGARVLVLVNDLGSKPGSMTAGNLARDMCHWISDGADADGVVVQRLRDRDALFRPDMPFDVVLDVLETAMNTKTDVAQLIARADPSIGDVREAIWFRLLNPVVFWIYVLSLKHRGLELGRIWTLSSDHHRGMWTEFDDEVTPGVAHLFVPALVDSNGNALMDGPVVDGSNRDAFAEQLLNAAGLPDAGAPELVPWTWQHLVELPARLSGDAVLPLVSAGDEIHDAAALQSALTGEHGVDVAGELADRIARGFYGHQT